VAILGISFDTMEENAAFAAKFKFPYPLLCDTERAIGVAYGACANPRDECARRITYIIGPDGRVSHAFRKVDARAHPAEVLKLV
jgi:peroxiredoxin Q/BCP